jgi:ATP-dependent protease ClpP protease subunit
MIHIKIYILMRKRFAEPIYSHKKKTRRLNQDIRTGKDDEDDNDNEDESGLDQLRTNLKDRMADLFGKQETEPKGKRNHIYFDNDVNRHNCRELINKLDELNRKLGKLECDYEMDQPPRIYLHINSCGGSLFWAFSVIDAMRRSKYPIVTIIEGCAASAATLISVFGTERWMTQHSYMLIHQLSSACWGKMVEIDDEYENLKEFMNQICTIYESKTNLTRKQLRELLKHDRWWNAQTCLEKGLIDKII